MELDEMKILWGEMSERVEEQKILTDKLIMEMTQERYTKRFSKISIYETIGSIICFVAAIILIMNFTKLDTWYLIVMGAFTLGYLILLPILTLTSLNGLRKVKITDKDYKGVLVVFEKAKNRLLFIQRLGIVFNFILMMALIPVAAKITNDNDVFMMDNKLWYYSMMFVMAGVVLFVSRWGYKCYKGITASAENVLKELEGE